MKRVDPGAVALISRGAYTARLATTDADVRAAQGLRHLAFRGGSGLDRDAFDTVCKHMLIEGADGRLVCCFRFLMLADGSEILRSYAAQHYDLSALQAFGGAMLEIGRFCVDPKVDDPDVLRIAWGALTSYVDATGVEMLFGCASFPGVEAAAYQQAFALLRARHLAPARWRPGLRAPETFAYAARVSHRPDPRQALRQMPPLLRTYLLMGGWVSDHAVVDRAMNTLHVFTGVEVAAIPAARKRLLRALAG